MSPPTNPPLNRFTVIFTAPRGPAGRRTAAIVDAAEIPIPHEVVRGQSPRSRFVATIVAQDPDDALNFIHEHFRGVRIQKCVDRRLISGDPDDAAT